MGRYSIEKIRTTAGNRYIILVNGSVSLSHRTYYKKKSNALKKVAQLNKKD